MAEELLSIWVVYDNPTDFPGHYVVLHRCRQLLRLINRDDRATASRNYDYIAAEMYAHGLIHMDRNPDDDPVIKETWL